MHTSSSCFRAHLYKKLRGTGRSTPPVSMDLKPALTLDVEAIDKAVDAVLEAPSLPKNQPFRRRWSAPNLAGLAELEERRRVRHLLSRATPLVLPICLRAIRCMLPC